MRPHDIVILLKIAAKGNSKWFLKDLANELNISNSEVSESLNRSKFAGLLSADKQSLMKNALLDFLQYGLKYVFPQKPGAITRGMATAHSAPPLDMVISGEETYVWPWAHGQTRGQSIEPLHKSVPDACTKDKELYGLLALTDAIRVGRIREQSLALEELKNRI